MEINEKILKNEELVIFRLRELYRAHGFSCFKMSKFEEYDLYSLNKDFLVSDSVITFNDTNGKLMALKPDVTLSIVKNLRGSGGVQRVYYNENVYRVSEKTHCYKEIMQTGIEALGELTEYDLFEVTALAAESLSLISPKSVLNISHLGVISSLLNNIKADEDKKAIIKCVGEKNAHGIGEICQKAGVCKASEELLKLLTSAYGDPKAVCASLKAYADDENIVSSISQLERIAVRLNAVSGIDVRVDFSLVDDMNYYNGLIFRGFVEDIPTGVLSGGQYDKLVTKLGKPGGAIGFAVYLDLLERMKAGRSYDVDVLLTYSPDDDITAVFEKAKEIISTGKTVSVQNTVPEKLTYAEKLNFCEVK